MENVNRNSYLSVLFCFFIMGFVDIVGTATSNIKTDLSLSNTMAGALPNFIFIWFILCSIPTGIMMDKIGRKNTVLVSNVITLVGMLAPVPVILNIIPVNLPVYLVSFVLLGIGNTILQVALNPLLTNVMSADKLTRGITIGQFVKALSSLLGPQIVLFSSVFLSDWNYVFVIYAVITLISSLWLYMSFVPREKNTKVEKMSFSAVLSLLKSNKILSLFVCILLIVGIDVGLNCFIPVIYGDVFNMEHPSGMNTFYFIARAIGALVCFMMLSRISSLKILRWTMVVSVLGYLLMIALVSFNVNTLWAQILFAVMFLPVGFATANVFSIIFSIALQYMPEKTSQISSLLIMGVAGGGATTLVMGALTDLMGLAGGMLVLLMAMIYIMYVAFKIPYNLK
ncbi:MFS transporter [Bacteroides sp.]|uniref:MFS transporter n=1 Tax=Bacteroides sp. TaxID=29523 RepID=UPI002587F004|nr:MFS transporter [Bacteroides sp.]